jgi:hypothetical protein
MCRRQSKANSIGGKGDYRLNGKQKTGGSRLRLKG